MNVNLRAEAWALLNSNTAVELAEELAAAWEKRTLLEEQIARLEGKLENATAEVEDLTQELAKFRFLNYPDPKGPDV